MLHLTTEADHHANIWPLQRLLLLQILKSDGRCLGSADAPLQHVTNMPQRLVKGRTGAANGSLTAIVSELTAGAASAAVPLT